VALLERARELEAVDVLVRAGGLLILEGPAGIGKTALLRSAAATAAAAGRRVLTARGAPLERAYAHGAVRQLLEREVDLESVLGASSPAVADPSGFAVLRALARLTLDLAEREPLVLLIDDAQWSDEASLRFAGFLARRLDGPEIAMCVGIRSGETTAPEQLLDDLREVAHARTLTPSALTSEATALALRQADPRLPVEVCVACHEATGGNPLLVHEVRRALGHGEDPLQAAAAGMAGAVERRIAASAPEAGHVARAAAVLGDDATLAALIGVSGLDAAACGRATAALSAIGVLERRGDVHRFTHPLVRSAVLDAIDDGQLAALRHAAVDVLEAAGAPAEQIAAQLLVTPGTGDASVATRLRAAAREALRRADPSAAIPMLRRALAEPPPVGERGPLSRDLGTALRLAGSAEAIDHLRAASAAATPHERAAIDREVALAESDVSRYAEAAATLSTALRTAPEDLDAAVRDALRVDLLSAAMVVPGLDQEAVVADLSRGAVPQDPAVTAQLTLVAIAQHVIAGDPVDVYAERLVRLLAEHPPAPDKADFHTIGWLSLIAGEQFDSVRALIDAADSDGPGWTRRRAAVHHARAQLEYRLGNLEAAVAVGNAAIEFRTDDHTGDMVHRAQLATALLERGELERATAVLGAVRVPAGRTEGHLAFVHWGLGRLAAAQGDDLRAVRAFDAGCALHALYDESAHTRWEAGGHDRVTCLLRVGRVADARDAVDRTLALAESAQLHGLRGTGLRLRGLLDDDLDTLAAAADVLRDTPLRLERARAGLDLGRALRRRGQRDAAREPLREALDLAHAMGAGPLAAQAREELLLSGARPRRDAHHGRDALTPAELRVARLLAEGATNREIARTLFITAKTAEGHTGRVLRKLGVASRTAVAQALEPADAS